MDLEVQKVERPIDTAKAVAQAVNISPRDAMIRMRKIEASKEFLELWRDMLIELGPFTLITEIKRNEIGEIEVSVAPSTSGAERPPTMSEKSYKTQIEFARREMRQSVMTHEMRKTFAPRTGLGLGVVPVDAPPVEDEPERDIVRKSRSLGASTVR